MNRRFALPLQKGVWEKHPRANWAPGKPIWKSGMLRERLLINWVEVGFQDWGSRYGFCRDRVGINPWGISCDFREQFHAELPLHFQILAWEFPQWRETFSSTSLHIYKSGNNGQWQWHKNACCVNKPKWIPFKYKPLGARKTESQYWVGSVRANRITLLLLTH